MQLDMSRGQQNPFHDSTGQNEQLFCPEAPLDGCAREPIDRAFREIFAPTPRGNQHCQPPGFFTEHHARLILVFKLFLEATVEGGVPNMDLLVLPVLGHRVGTPARTRQRGMFKEYTC